MSKFVEDWNIIQTLGEGAYAEVKLLVHNTTGDCVAMKVVDLNKHKDAKSCTQKEMKIHMFLVHPNIVRMLGKREDEEFVYMFLEYAVGGELFNKIEPDVGMPSAEAQKYMRQLMAGLQYLFDRGIAHRDLKPENLLLDEFGNLKISDFGMATIYRLKAKERLLDRKCGTLPYVAPEVLESPYHAEPADIWSCGIIFVAMMSGELPWDEPSYKCSDYLKWKSEKCIMRSPWNKLDNTAIGLARKILDPNPKHRPSIKQIKNHPWMINIFDSCDSIEEIDGYSDEPNPKRLASIAENSRPNIPYVVFSQPATSKSKNIDPTLLARILESRDVLCFSQPAQHEELLVCSQMPLTQGNVNQSNFEKMIKRMTRFIVSTDLKTTIELLLKVLDKVGLTHKSDESGSFTICTIDSRKTPLVFKVNIWDLNDKLLVDFRLNKGCGLEFKKRFVKIKDYMSEIIVKN